MLAYLVTLEMLNDKFNLTASQKDKCLSSSLRPSPGPISYLGEEKPSWLCKYRTFQKTKLGDIQTTNSNDHKRNRNGKNAHNISIVCACTSRYFFLLFKLANHNSVY